LRIKFYILIYFLWGYFNLWLESKVMWVVPSHFCSFLIIYFQFHPSILDWLEIEFHNLFWFAFYWVILVSWSKFNRLIWVDSSFLSFFYRFFFSISFFNIRLIELVSIYFIYLFSMRLLQSHNLSRKFYMLT